MIFTNAAAKRDFYLIRHLGVNMSPVPRHTHHQDVLGEKIVASSFRHQVGRVWLSCFVKTAID